MSPHPRHPRPARYRAPLALLVALAPACCAPSQPPPPAAALPEPPPPPSVHATRPLLRTAWSFKAAADACTALSRAGPASLLITIRPEGPIRLTLSLPANPPEHPSARFSGPAGRWQIDAAYAGGRTATFILPPNDASLSRVLMLLSGGLLKMEPAHEDVPIMSLPESGAAGRQWFACARHAVNGT